MMTTARRILGAALCATTLLVSSPAQEQGVKPKPAKKVKKAVPMRAMRLVAAGKPKAMTPEELKKRFDAKMAEPFVSKVAWVADYDKARAQAKATGKTIFAYFTRSYAP